MLQTSTLQTDRRQAIAALIAVNAMWGASFPIMKCINQLFDSHFNTSSDDGSNLFRISSAAWMIAVRFSIALVLFLLVFRKTSLQVRGYHLAAGAAIGTFFFLGLLCQVIGLATIPASRSGFLTSLTVVITPLIGTLIQKRLPRLSAIAGAFIALLGVAILTGLLDLNSGVGASALDDSPRWAWGDAITILGAGFFSVQILLVDRLGKNQNSAAFTPGMFAASILLSVAVFGIASPGITENSTGWFSIASKPEVMILIAILALIPSLIAFYWMNKYQPMVTATQAAVIYTLEPLFASCWAMVLPAALSVMSGVVYANEQFSTTIAAGGSLVLLANILALWPQSKTPCVEDHESLAS